MKASRLIPALTCVVLALAPVSALGQAGARNAVPAVSPAVVRACAGVARNIVVEPTCATALAASLQANAADINALLAAARAADGVAPKLILARYGLTPQQLEGATVAILDQTDGAGAARIKKVTIEISCCPLTITIIIHL